MIKERALLKVWEKYDKLMSMAYDAAINRICTWTWEEDEGLYYTSCGNNWYFLEGDLSDNKATKYCQYCGGLITLPYWSNQMTKERAWEEYRLEHEQHGVILDQKARIDFKAGYDSAMNRTCTWTLKEKVFIDKSSLLCYVIGCGRKPDFPATKVHGKHCQYCGGKIMEE